MELRAPKRTRRRPRRRLGRKRAGLARDRAGRAGLIATFLMGLAGIALGAGVAYLSGRGDIAAAYGSAPLIELRGGEPIGAESAPSDRSRIVELILSGGAPERLAAPAMAAGAPRIIVIFDDMGLDRAVFESVMRLPGPLTLSFLPYGKDPQPMVDAARERGDAVLLHLPMEPAGGADPGPHVLKGTMSATDLLTELEWNLGRIHGYIGVNNHMGSKLTRDEATMKTILSVINERGLFFVDSLTTGKSAAKAAGEAIGARVYARDVFLDPNAGKETVIRQLEQVERIAVETGFVVAICHPHPDTLAVIGPWLTSAPTRGFRLDTVASLGALEGAWKRPAQVAARD